MKKIISILLFLSVAFIACNSSTKKNKSNDNNPVLNKQLYTKAGLWKQIQTMENTVDSATSQQALAAGNSLITYYEDYIRRYPEDKDRVKHCLFDGGRLAMNLHQSKKALKMFEQYRNDYHLDKKSSTCLFLEAFIYENQLNELGKAKQTYQQFINDYPNDELVKDAKLSIQNLGKSPEQLAKEFEAKNKDKAEK